MISYLKNYGIYVLQVCLLVLLSQVSWAKAGVPSATTASRQVIDVKVEGAVSLYGESTAYTNTIATAISTQPGINENNLPSPSRHDALSEMSVFATNISDTFITLVTDGYTFSAASTYEPLFARSYALGEASTFNLLSTGIDRKLVFDWQIENYLLKNNPTVSFSKITDTLKVTSQSVSIQDGQINPSGEKYVTVFDITSSIENDHLVSPFSAEEKASELIIQGSIPFEIDLSQNHENSDYLVIEIEHIQTQYAIEAPALATNQVEEKAGYDGSDGVTSLSWDATKKELSFAPIPINILNDGDGNSLQTKYINDPLNGGYIDIDPLSYIENYDGIDYFEGNEVKLFDKDGNVLLRASLPTLVFDDDLYEMDGFNLFAPIVNILEVDPLESLWLQDYLKKGGLDSLLLNELFIGFDTNGFSRSDDFEAPVTAFLSYTGIPVVKVPEPEKPFLFFVAMLVFIAHFTFVKNRSRG